MHVMIPTSLIGGVRHIARISATEAAEGRDIAGALSSRMHSMERALPEKRGIRRGLAGEGKLELTAAPRS